MVYTIVMLRLTQVKKYYKTENIFIFYSGEYSCLSVEFGLKSEPSFHIVTVYIPYIMMIAVSFTSFWLKQKDTLTRIGINLVMLFMASTKSEKIMVTLPNVAYTKVFLC